MFVLVFIFNPTIKSLLKHYIYPLFSNTINPPLACVAYKVSPMDYEVYLAHYLYPLHYLLYYSKYLYPPYPLPLL